MIMSANSTPGPSLQLRSKFQPIDIEQATARAEQFLRSQGGKATWMHTSEVTNLLVDYDLKMMDDMFDVEAGETPKPCEKPEPSGLGISSIEQDIDRVATIPLGTNGRITLILAILKRLNNEKASFWQAFTTPFPTPLPSSPLPYHPYFQQAPLTTQFEPLQTIDVRQLACESPIQ
jgi:hypothetical protein